MREDRRRATRTLWAHAALFAAALLWAEGAEALLARLLLGPEPAFSEVEIAAFLADPDGAAPDAATDAPARIAERNRTRSSTPFGATVALLAWAPIGLLAGRLLPGIRWIGWMPLSWVAVHIAASTWTWSGIHRFAGGSPQARDLERVAGVVSARGFVSILGVSLLALYTLAYLGTLRRGTAVREAL